MRSTLTQASLLRPWIRCFMMIISAWWFLNKQQIKKARSTVQAENSETMATPKRVWIRPMYNALSLSRDRKINMKKSTKKINHLISCDQQPPANCKASSSVVCLLFPYRQYKNKQNKRYNIMVMVAFHWHPRGCNLPSLAFFGAGKASPAIC